MLKMQCNMCGKSFDTFDEQGGVSICKTLGYGTKYDGEILRLDLCCECLDNLIDKCVLSPIEPQSTR